MRPLIIGLLLFSTSALAQTIQLSGQDGNEILVGPGDCDGERVVNWTRSGSFCDVTRLWITSGTCGTAPDTGDPQLGAPISESDTATSGTRDFRIRDLPAFVGGEDAIACGTQGVTRTFNVCASTKRVSTDIVGNVTCSSDFTTASGVTITYDAEAPGAPTVSSVVPLDSALNVRVASGGGDPNRFRVRVTRISDNQEVASRTESVEQSLFRMDGLENGVTYRVEAFAIDEVGNVSAASAPQEGTPIPTAGFFQRYVDAQGDETGGCSATGGGLAGSAVLAALGFWLSSRRNRS